ncbi:MAG TPA: DUF502 domain-containing protein [Candidatus Omnitrophota bacterium]|nr:DUF502 domain-containing protein [Candidatus Omnitrophota bacterium]HOX09284.1 DUF502 domain-containing protein [Candidatus Omnitrophota bacterium]HRZ67054.1 DUF502 domain-containing protein [Candidatus Omnitrophota bacterium]
MRKNFLAGIVVIIPALVTYWLIVFVLTPFDALFIKRVMVKLEPYYSGIVSPYLVKAGLYVAVIGIIVFIGFGTRVLVLKKLFSYFERKFFHVPMLGKVYSATREISQAFLGQTKGIFTRVVLVEFPHKKTYALGFVTSEGKGEVQDKTIERVINVFVPTTPNPTSGFLLLVPESEMISLDMSVEEGLKLVISGGIVPLPDRVNIKKKNGNTDD